LLYTLNAVVQTFGGKLSPAAALGSLSLIVWLLIITISIKYCLFVMRADQHGEGGILVLMSLTGASWHGRGRAIIVMGLFGAALLYGDGIVTPAIFDPERARGPQRGDRLLQAACHADGGGDSGGPIRGAEPRDGAHRVGVRSGHARLVCHHRGARARGHHAPARRHRRPQPGASGCIPPRQSAHRIRGARRRVPGGHRPRSPLLQ